MDEKDTLRLRLRSTIDEQPEWDDEKVAAEVLSGYATRKALAEAVANVVANESSRLRRDGVRRRERATFEALNESIGASGGAARHGQLEDVEQLRPSDRFFCTRDGVEMEVTWDDATIDDHLSRISVLRRPIAGTLATIARHEKAVELIRSHNARCLADVPGWRGLLVLEPA